MTDPQKHENFLNESLKRRVAKFNGLSITISGVALAISLIFIKDLVPPHLAVHSWLLYLGLMVLCICLALGFIAQYLNSRPASQTDAKTGEHKTEPRIRLSLVVLVPLGVFLIVGYGVLNMTHYSCLTKNVQQHQMGGELTNAGKGSSDSLLNKDANGLDDTQVTPQIKIINANPGMALPGAIPPGINATASMVLFGRLDPNTGNFIQLSLQSAETIRTIDSAHAKNAKVYLSIRNFGYANTKQFLKNSKAQQTTINHIDAFLALWTVDGIMIHFEQIPNSIKDDFTQFISLLSRTLTKSGRDIELLIHIPGHLANESGLAFDFVSLGPLASYFIISNAYAAPASGSWNMEATIHYYLNGKIPADKLMLSVPCDGCSWERVEVAGKAFGAYHFVLERRLGGLYLAPE